ncbi:alpha/beta fold hydrolase [Streptomyces aurantiacus]|uniref:Putative Pimelyl-[acyl-carrier protein] methyl ester esterase n=1 Tax=Streptomyces aurantiacus JA 4570 TaxID=1286094 RepID=S3ZN55_9ACTN|nr:alpha/beta fold hydrolase [Streptomyces aurantiacus]EPH44966.1 putative Pimelyl-[acyl-carrier protein] methyl ester esterase [Streptomyces aurantiacus JA 4570]
MSTSTDTRTSTDTTAAPYARTITGKGPALLLAHGAGGSVAANYGPILPALTETHRAIAVDYPGTGKTPRAEEPLTLDTLADELIAAADAEGADTFALAGYSLGTAVAIRTAARHPSRVKALILTAPFARPDTRMTLNAQTWHHLAAAGTASRDRDKQARFLLPLALSPGALDALSPQALADALRGTAESAPEGTADHVDLVIRTDVRADLAAITAPTLVITTTEDQLVPPALQREVAAGIRGARLAAIETGHLPFAERPTEWQRLITDFLTEQRLTTGAAE